MKRSIFAKGSKPHLHAQKTNLSALRNSTDRYLPVAEEKTLAEFMRTGEFGHHLRRMRELYAECWSVFSEAAQNFLSDWLDLQRPNAASKPRPGFRLEFLI
jgi:DNA-binding transcriptional MocR family regulator